MTDLQSIHTWLQARCEAIAKNPPSARWNLSVETSAIADFLTEALGGAMPKAKCDCPKCKGTGVVWEGIQSFACIGCQGRSCGHYQHTERVEPDALPLFTGEGDIIHAAEGVTLEPGEYEVAKSTDGRGIGPRVRVTEPNTARVLALASDAPSWYVVIDQVGFWVTAVRRVDPKPASEPVAPAALGIARFADLSEAGAPIPKPSARTVNWAREDMSKRVKGCTCQLEEGDSPCVVHTEFAEVAPAAGGQRAIVRSAQQRAERLLSFWGRCRCVHAPEQHWHKDGCEVVGCECRWRNAPAPPQQPAERAEPVAFGNLREILDWFDERNDLYVGAKEELEAIESAVAELDAVKRESAIRLEITNDVLKRERLHLSTITKLTAENATLREQRDAALATVAAHVEANEALMSANKSLAAARDLAKADNATLRERLEAAERVELSTAPVEPETTRGQLQWGLDCVAGVLGRPSLLVGEHSNAVAEALFERDATITKLTAELENRQAELARLRGQRSNLRTKLEHQENRCAELAELVDKAEALAVKTRLEDLDKLAAAEREHERTLKRRDELVNKLDAFVELAGGEDECGEHSSDNDPWRRAYEHFEQLAVDSHAEAASVEKAEMAKATGSGE